MTPAIRTWLDKNGHGKRQHKLVWAVATTFGVDVAAAAGAVRQWMTYK